VLGRSLIYYIFFNSGMGGTNFFGAVFREDETNVADHLAVAAKLAAQAGSRLLWIPQRFNLAHNHRGSFEHGAERAIDFFAVGKPFPSHRRVGQQILLSE